MYISPYYHVIYIYIYSCIYNHRIYIYVDIDRYMNYSWLYIEHLRYFKINPLPPQQSCGLNTYKWCYNSF